jgi:hypothetical protein
VKSGCNKTATCACPVAFVLDILMNYFHRPVASEFRGRRCWCAAATQKINLANAGRVESLRKLTPFQSIRSEALATNRDSFAASGQSDSLCDAGESAASIDRPRASQEETNRCSKT